MKSSGRAFTLVELAVAVSILSIGIAASLRSFIGFNEAFNSLENQVQAVYLLQAKLDQLMQAFYADGALAVSEDSGALQINRRSAAWSMQVVPVKENPLGKDLEALTIRLSWKESGRAKELSLTRYIRQQRKEQQ